MGQQGDVVRERSAVKEIHQSNDRATMTDAPTKGCQEKWSTPRFVLEKGGLMLGRFVGKGAALGLTTSTEPARNQRKTSTKPA